MRVGPFEITRRKSAQSLVTQWPTAWDGWRSITEVFAGAWQRGVRVDRQSAMTYGTVWACVTLIASDIAKLWINLVEKDGEICTPVQNPSYSPVLRKPNHYQTRVKFVEAWQLSRLLAGNTYVLKERGGDRKVRAMYVLDPQRVQALVAPNGDVYYQLGTDHLAGLTEASITVPARDIIHDRCVEMFHPLCGVSPLTACGLAATQGLRIQEQSSKFFERGATVSGILTAPGHISTETAQRLEKYWNDNFTGANNAGKVAALGDGLKFESMVMKAVDAQLVDQLKWTDAQICACFHVPGYMVGVGPAPPYTDIQSINLQYYTQALQNPIENMELLLEDGLGLDPAWYGIEFDLDALARMDTKTQMEIAKTGVMSGIESPNEARARFNRKPVKGGDTPYLQQQNYSLEALDRRDQASPTPNGDSLPSAPMPQQDAGKAVSADDAELLALYRARALVKGIDVPSRRAA